MYKTILAFAALTVLAAPTAAQERSRDTFNWSGRVPAGRWIQVRNINGEIRIEPATGDQVKVTAVKTWRRGDPEDVRIEVKKVGPGDEDVMICALWSADAY